MSRFLDGVNPGAYRGVKPPSPPNMVIPGIKPTSQPRDPTQQDINYNLGDFWLNTTTEGLWVLVFLGSHLVSSINTRYATWVQIVTGGPFTAKLSGDSGINPVSPDGNDNINVFGDNTVGLTVAGDGLHTLLVTTVSGHRILEGLTGNTGGLVTADVNNNINIIGSADITVTGNPGTNTLTIGIVGGGVFGRTITGDTGGAVPPSAGGNWNLLGAHGINVAGTPGTNTLNPAINNAITLGDLAVLTAGNDALTITSGNITLSGTGANAAGNISLPNTTTDGRQGIINFGGSRFIHNWGTNNVFIGRDAGNLTMTGIQNLGIGVNALLAVTTGQNNTMFGHAAGDAITTGQDNHGFGSNALGSVTTGDDNSSISGLQLLTTGDLNVALGNNAGALLVSGSHNTYVGASAGGGQTTNDSNNICVGYLSGSTAGDNNTLRIGAGAGTGAGQLNRAFIHGIRGITTGNADAIAVLVDSAGQLGTVSSSVRFKENIEDMADYSADIMHLRPVTFDYKNHSSQRKSVGLIAEEVGDIMPDLVVFDEEGLPETVQYHNLIPMMLNELQKLRRELDSLKNG